MATAQQNRGVVRRCRNTLVRVGEPGEVVGKASVTVCVRTPCARGPAQVRDVDVSRRSFVRWGDAGLAGRVGVTVAAIESTSTYWKPPFYWLEEVMDVWLLNAAHMKAVPGRKTDVKDAEWIAQLREHGVLRLSFVPPPAIRRLRLLTHNRDQLLAESPVVDCAGGPLGFVW